VSDLLTGLVVVPLVVSAEQGRFGRSQYACLAVFCLTATQVNYIHLATVVNTGHTTTQINNTYRWGASSDYISRES